MPITINGSGSITGISAGGLPDLSITTADLADGAVTDAKVNASAAIADSKLSGTTCKAWVNYNGVTPGIRASGNVSSVTKNGTGDYTVNFTTAMSDANYSIVCGLRNSDNLYLHTCTIQNFTTALTQIVTKQSNQSGSTNFLDYNLVCIAIFR